MVCVWGAKIASLNSPTDNFSQLVCKQYFSPQGAQTLFSLFYPDLLHYFRMCSFLSSCSNILIAQTSKHVFERRFGQAFDDVWSFLNLFSKRPREKKGRRKKRKKGEKEKGRKRGKKGFQLRHKFH